MVFVVLHCCFLLSHTSHQQINAELWNLKEIFIVICIIDAYIIPALRITCQKVIIEMFLKNLLLMKGKLWIIHNRKKNWMKDDTKDAVQFGKPKYDRKK